MSRSILIACAVVGFAGTCVLTPRPVRAEQSEVIHFMGQLLPPDEGAMGTDFEADNSKRIVANNGGESSAEITFIGPNHPGFAGEEGNYRIRDESGNLLLDLFNTTWTELPVLHVRQNGAEQIDNALWLQQENTADNAGPGTTAKTGPNGDVFGVTTIWIAQLPASDSYYPNRWYVTTSVTGTAKLSISFGFFNK